jgi:hypothetical protein
VRRRYIADVAIQGRGGFSMFSLSMPVEPGDATGVAISNLFFLPATVQPLEGPILEEVVLLRDELANLGWAIERRLESPLETGRRNYQAARWHDGRLFVWAGNRASVGRGEASSGLAFEALES